MEGYPAHVVLFGHGEAHSPCENSLFLLESLVDGRAQRLGMARTAAACGYVVGTVLPDDPASPALCWHTACEGIDKPATHFVKKCV